MKRAAPYLLHGLLPPESLTLVKFIAFLAANFVSLPAEKNTLRQFLRTVKAASRKLYPQATLKHAGERALFVLRNLQALPSSRKWVEFLQRGPMAEISRANSHLFKKIIRPYVARSWSNERKLKALTDNYTFWQATLAPEVFRALFSANGVTLCIFTTQDGDTFELHLTYDSKFNKEGEITLELISSNHCCRISALAFHVGKERTGKHAIVIGSLQGLAAGNDKEIIKAVSKIMHGLRPKALLFQVVQEIARYCRVDCIRGISNQEHNSRHISYALNRTRRPRLTYNEFWQEMGGTLSADGFFDLPPRPQMREACQVKSNKRALYRQRYALLEQLQVGIGRTFAHWAWTNPPATTRPTPSTVQRPA